MNKPSQNELNKIIELLKTNPEGIWLRALSRELKMPISSLHYRLHTFLKDKIIFKKMEHFGFRSQHVIVKLK